MSTDFQLFPGKNLGDLFKDIYNNQQLKKRRISELIKEIRDLLAKDSNTTIGNVALLAPLIRDLVDSSVRNDESLLKLATIAQRIVAASGKSDEDSGFLTDAEKVQLLKEVEETVAASNEITDTKVDELTFDVEEIKQKIEE